MSNLLVIDGFDMYNGVGANTGLGAKWSAFGGVAMATGRFGEQGVQVNPTASQGQILRTFSPSVTALSACMAQKWTTMTSVTGSAVLLELSGGGQIGYRVLSTGAIEVARYSSNLAPVAVLGTSATGVILLNTWHFVEFSVVISSTVGTVTVKVDGTAVLTLTGQNTQQQGTANVDTVRIGGNGNNQNWVVIVDDFYVVDSATSLGEARVETLRPTADSSVTWTPNSGVTNYSRVNETLVDGDTSYVQTSTVGNRDLYSITGLSSTPASIFAVQVSSFAEKTDALTRALYNSVQSAGTDSDGSSFALAASYGKFERIMPTDPNGGGSWAATRVNGLLIGPKVAA